MLPIYIQTAWKNGMAPPINGVNLNKIEDRLALLTDGVNTNIADIQKNVSDIGYLRTVFNEVIANATIDSEVIAARTSGVTSTTFPSLGLRLDWIEQNAGGGIQSVVAGDNVTIDNTDPDNPIINSVPVPDARITNSISLSPEDVIGNQKTADGGQDVSEWTVGSGTLSQDTINVKIGSGAIKISEPDNTAGVLYADKNNLTLDFTKLDNGETSGDTDYIYVAAYLSNVAKVSSVSFRFSQDAVYTNANIKYIVISSGLITGWNYFKLKKSTFLTAGGGAWDGIQSLRVEWSSLVNAQSEYVSLQLIQLVKKDSLADYPNPFQDINGNSIFAINSGEWYVGYENGKPVVKELSGATEDVNALERDNAYDNFILYGSKITTRSDRDRYFTMYIDDNNHIVVYFSSDTLTLLVKESGSITIFSGETFDIAIGDKIDYKLEKSGENLILNATVNGTMLNPLKTTTVLNSLKLALGADGNGFQVQYNSVSITELHHANTANVADVAKSIARKTKNGAFIADELSYGEEGLDTANNRLYMKYSSTQVIYFQGTVV